MKKELFLIGIVACILIVAIPVSLFGTVYFFTGNYYPNIDNTFIFFATIIGACFSGFITAIGLYLTLKQNSKELQKQREFDKKGRDEEKDNFKKQYNILIINEKLKLYETLFKLRIKISETMGGIDPGSSYNTYYSQLKQLFELADEFEFIGSQLFNKELYQTYKNISTEFYEFKKLYSEGDGNQRKKIFTSLNTNLVKLSDDILKESRKESEKKFKEI